MRRGEPTIIDSLFNNNGEVKHKIRVSPFFLRKPYQYTSAEPKDDTQQKLHENDWLKY